MYSKEGKVYRKCHVLYHEPYIYIYETTIHSSSIHSLEEDSTQITRRGNTLKKFFILKVLPVTKKLEFFPKKTFFTIIYATTI